MHHAAPSPAFVADVHEALRLWAKDPSAGSPLAELALTRQEIRNGRNIRRATNQVLLAALKKLAIESPQDAALLRARFLDGKTITAIANERNVADITIYKLQRRALAQLAATLYAMEQQAVQESRLHLTAHLPPATYDRLFGVDASVETLRRLLLAAEEPRIIAIEGLGGIGKTALAHYLIHDIARHHPAFVGFGWVSAQQQLFQAGEGIKLVSTPALTVDTLVEALVVQLMPEIAAGPPLAPDRAMNMLAARLQVAPYLIVVDNLETIADVESLLPTLLRLAGPSKFLLTSREAFYGQPGIHHFPVPELDEAAALALVRHLARLQGMTQVADAADHDLHPIYATVGGNPLALRLVVGQLHILPLAQVLDSLREARGRRIEELYTFIYWNAWHRLPAAARDVLVLMPLFSQDGADLAALRRVCDLPEDELVAALAHLAKLSLVNLSGDLYTRRYSIHRLTESFLLKEVIKWQGADEVPT